MELGLQLITNSKSCVGFRFGIHTEHLIK